MRRSRLAVSLIFVLMTTSLPVHAARPPIELHVGDAVFVRGPHIERATSSEACAQPGCWTYRFRVNGGADRLRIGIDHPDHHDRFTIEVRNPSGRAVAMSRHGYLETPEIIVPAPEPGVWKVLVMAVDVEDSAFEVRAVLQDVEPRRAPGRLLLPNLRPEPGFDFSLVTSVGANLGLESVVPISCHADETVEDVVVRCLRFSFGYQNAGDGPMDLRFESLADPATITAKVRQRIFRSDRTVTTYDDNRFVERPAGTATYHKIHGHYHYNAVFQARLHKVESLAKGELTSLGEAAKRGACAHDWVLVDFDLFYQDRAGTADSGSDCSFAFTDPTSERTRIGLSTGWADIYTAELSDNYVDFGLNGDGLYLVRVASDPDDMIKETKERDNVGYSLIEVEGEEVRLIERGRGTGPWDPRKIELVGLGE